MTAALASISLASIPVAAHSPEELEAALGNREQFFQPVGREAPAFVLEDADGQQVRLSDLNDKVVVLHFIYTNCPDVCPLHAEALAEVQEKINLTPMKDQVLFISITTAPYSDTAEVMREYGPLHGLDQANWTFLSSGPERPEATTRKLAEAFGHKFIPLENGDYQLHSVVTHLIDRQGIWRGNFHGLRFDPTNLVSYINGLTNEFHRPGENNRPGWWQRIREKF